LDFTEQIKNYLDGFNLSRPVWISSDQSLIRQLLQVYMRQGRVYIFGNGGSAPRFPFCSGSLTKG
jgi:phosphoheptose isomerase